MLARKSVVGALMLDGGNDAGLSIVPGDDADARLFAQPRVAPVGRNGESRRKRTAAGQRGDGSLRIDGERVHGRILDQADTRRLPRRSKRARRM